MHTTVKNIKRRRLFILNIILVLLLCGCIKNGKTEQQSGATTTYHAERVSLVNAASYYPKDIMFVPGEDQCCITSQTEEEYSVYLMKIDSEAKPQKLLDFAGGTFFSCNVSDAASGNKILSLFAFVDDETHMYEYDLEGKLMKDILLKDPDAYRLYAFAHWRLPNGEYVAIGRQKMLAFNGEGESGWQIDCPEGDYQGGILTSGGAFYITYIDREQKCQLAELDYQSGKLKGLFEIPGVGQVICESMDGGLFTMDADSMYRIDTERKKSDPILKFESIRGIVSRRISSMREENGRIELLSWDPANPWKYLECVAISTKEQNASVAQLGGESQEAKIDASGRQIITLYDPYGMAQYMIGSTIIDGFNEESENYVIHIDASQPNVNARLADSDSPDLVLLLIDSDMEKYYENGYLENLQPYFEKSDIVPASEIASQFYKAYGFDKGLYSVCRYSTFSSLYGLESEVGSKEGWTVEEFLDWIERHPDLDANAPVTCETLLEYCLRGNMDHYVTEEGKVCFEGDAFRNLLERLKKMNCNIEANSQLPYEEKKEPEQALFQYMSLQDVSMLARTEDLYGEKLVKKGFPNDDGKAVDQLFGWGNICMLKRASCKEGAFEFLEYMLIDPWYEIQNSSNEYGKSNYYDAQGSLFAVNKIRNLDMERALGEHIINFYEGNDTFREGHFSITAEQEERVIKAWEDALPDTYENQMIREIVEEETQAYFAGQKSLDETCKVIQNRVQLFLNER